MDFGSSNIVPGTPSVKRQKTQYGYNTTSTNEHNYDESPTKTIPETPDCTVSQKTLVINPSAPPPVDVWPFGTFSSNSVQVPASSPFTTSNTPARERAQESSRRSFDVTAATLSNPNSSCNQSATLANDRILNCTHQRNSNVKDENPLSEKPIEGHLKAVDVEDGLLHEAESLEDDVTEVNTDIIPVKFSKGDTQSSHESSSQIIKPSNHFKDIIQNAVYEGPSIDNRKPINARNGNRNLTSGPPHARIERAQPINDILIDDIPNGDTKTNIIRLRSIFPSTSVLAAKDALVKSNDSFDQAASFLASNKPSIKSPNLKSSTQILIIDDDDDLEDSESERKSEPQMKRTLKAPAQSIRDRYSSTQISHPNRINGSTASNPPTKSRRLVQGRKNLSSLGSSRLSSPIKSPSPLRHFSISDTESEIEIESINDNEGLDARVLKFLNTCGISDLVELANISKEIAEIMLAARPFKSLDSARTVENSKKLKSGKKSVRAPIGDKIVDTATEMFRGYDAIDTLVQKCNELSKPLISEISEWGFDVYGAQKNGELDMTSIDEDVASDKEKNKSPISPSMVDDEVKINKRKRKNNQFLSKPKLMAEDCILKDYQVVGMNWLALMSRNGLSGILADEMGLGKTCQVISFLAHLVETGNHGPHLVVCPGSTLENWLREISRFAPKLTFEPYHGPQKERQVMADEILQNKHKINVVVTTYDMAAKKEDNKFMRRLKPDVCIYDEGHMLKNVKSQRYQGLTRIPARFRLLLTGTPLQNNLQELAALLAFILPDVFKDLEEDLNTIFKAKATTSDSDHAALLSTQRIDRARSMLAPFVLRRKKAQVLKHLPAKHCRTEYCNLHKAQKEIYDGHLEQARERAQGRTEISKSTKTDEKNPLMQLRKAAIHPLLFRRHFSNEKIEKMADILRKKEPTNFPSHLKREHLISEMRAGSDFWLHQWCRTYPCIAKYDIHDLAWMDSGKVESMMNLIKRYKENGDRVLVFSQFSLVLDIIEAVLNTSRVDFTRIDGSTKIDERQSLIDTFRDDESITVFLLTTKAGGTGINLMYANKVIIFDGSFNPQDDKQAENRAHRVGQTREVEVVRLVTKGTVEEQILALGDSKLQLDGRVSGDDDGSKLEVMAEKTVARMLFSEGTSGANNAAESEQKKTSDKRDSNAEDKKSNASRKKNSILGILTQKKKNEKNVIKNS
ncbi:ATP-dependent helicase fft2 [Golovinomyces cichoracearum]|uniref:DNA helicase n=1 Tax=Golovinomyces cichoracearum TaxID=62708 RepID=A0A420HD29_9PEZI|nr:ATP-dependent helicase fft2 [Golovinomyces cichoracearum]